MNPNCIIPVAANCRDSKTETDVCFKVTATGAILHGSVTLEFDCENGGALTGKTFTSDAGTEYSSEDAVEVGCPPLVMTIPMAGAASGGGGGPDPSGGLTNEELRSAPLYTVVMETPGLTASELHAAPIAVTVTNPTPAGLTNAELRATAIATTSAQLPATIGAKNTAGSLSVTLAADSAPTALRPLAQASANYLPAKVLSSAGTNSTSVKSGVSALHGFSLFNTSAAMRYFKFYNGGGNPSVGVSTVAFTIPIPPGRGSNIALTHGVGFTAGLSYAITSGSADTDATPVAAADVIGVLFYA